MEIIGLSMDDPVSSTNGGSGNRSRKVLDILNVQVKFRTPRGNWSQSLTWKNKDPFPKRSDHPVEWP